MKLKIESSWHLLLTTGYRYRVTSIVSESHWDGQHISVDNRLFDPVIFNREEIVDRNGYVVLTTGSYATNRSHLRKDIRLWLEESLPWNSWIEDWTDNLATAGLRFSHKKYITLFKMRWG